MDKLMKNIKSITIPFYLMFVLNFSGSSYINELHNSANSVSHQKVEILEAYNNIDESRLIDCTITINSDGMELEVTFHDVSRFRCALIKVGKWFQDTF